jgi:Ase1/PRC1/MAP65 family protein
MLTGMENRIIEAREHALSRKDILEKVEKWTLASADEYERVPNSPPTPNPYMLFCK